MTRAISIAAAILVLAAAALYGYGVSDDAMPDPGFPSEAETEAGAEARESPEAVGDLSGEYIRTREDGSASGQLVVQASGRGQVRVSGEAYWGSTPNYGSLEAVLTMTDGKARYVEGRGDDACTIEFVFFPGAIDVAVADLAPCAEEPLHWGANVDFSGRYVKDI